MGRGRRGNAKKGEPPSNVTFDLRPESPDYKKLLEYAESLGRDHPLMQLLDARANAFAKQRGDGSGRAAVPRCDRGGCIRLFRRGARARGPSPSTSPSTGNPSPNPNPNPNPG